MSISPFLWEVRSACSIIKGKRVFIFEEHHHALYPWALIKRENLENDFNLFSFDYHTDTHDPFLYNAYYHKWDDNKVNNMISSIKVTDDKTIVDAINYLRHDEHICTAIKSGIIK